ncbi:MAG: winged helix-turn-helix domain-containing protein [Eggerthellaceae bacterium]|jgi:molybdate transport system regulatory protein
MGSFDNLGVMAKVFLTYSDDSDDGFAVFGHGFFLLLRGIQNYGSINKAAKDLDMSYSKAWNLVKHSEERFGVPLIESNVPRGSRLTDQGKSLLAVYNRVNAEVKEFAEHALADNLDGFDLKKPT